MSYSGIAPGYAQPPGPGGVFNAFGVTHEESTIPFFQDAGPANAPHEPNCTYMATWSNDDSDELFRSSQSVVAVVKPELAPVWEQNIKEWAVTHGRTRGIWTLKRFCPSDPSAGFIVTHWVGDQPSVDDTQECPEGMVEVPGGGCQLAPTTGPAPLVDFDKLATQMLIGGVVLTGVALTGFYLFTRKR